MGTFATSGRKSTGKFGLLSLADECESQRPYIEFSIIISTYDRYEHLLYVLDNYGNADMPHLDAIFIAWVRQNRPDRVAGNEAKACLTILLTGLRCR